MSRTVENRVVQMQFENKQFEDAVAESRQSIQLLEKDLKLLEGVQALKNIDLAVQSIDVSSIAKGIETLNNRFSTLGIIGMSVTNTLTSAFTGNLLGAISTVASKITGLFSTIYEKGLTRATNIQQSNFALQGLLSTQYKIQDANGQWIADMDTVKAKQKEIGNVIDASVKGTAYGYDQASRVASTLAASYGTSSEGIARIGVALKSIVGMAGQTGQDFDSVARVFTKVAASGKAMSMELNSISAWGVGAVPMLAEYINKNDELKKSMNDVLRTRKNARAKYQEITDADVYELASKGAITSDIFMEVFGVFFENAQKANDTLSGITSNIYAALGRLGASFIQPIMENEGPLVKFLQAVRIKLVDILNLLNDVHFQDKVLQPVIKGLETLTDIVNNFKFPNELRDFFSVIGTAFGYETPEWVNSLSSSTSELLDNLIKANTVNNGERQSGGTLAKRIEERLKRYILEEMEANGIATQFSTSQKEAEKIMTEHYGQFVDILGNSISENTVYKNAMQRLVSEWLEASTQTEYGEDEILRAALVNLQGTDAMYNFYEKILKEDVGDGVKYKGLVLGDLRAEMNRIRELHREEIDAYENKTLTKPLEVLIEDAEEISKANEKLKKIYAFDYVKTIADALSNLGQAFINIKDIFFDTFVSQTSSLKEYFTEGFTGATALRLIINKLSEGFLNLSKKIKGFFESETGINIIKGLGAAFAFLANVVKAVIDILGNAFTSFTPLFERILNLFGDLGLFISDMNDNADDMDVWTHIVKVLSTIIDWIAIGLTKLWDLGAKILEPLKSGNISNSLGTLIGWLKEFGIYLYNNLPVWIEKATPYIEKFVGALIILGKFIADNLPIWIEKASPYIQIFGEKILEVGEFLSDVLGEGLSLVSPYIEKFAGWLSEATDGAVDLENPIETVNTLLEENSDTLGTVNSIAGTVSNTLETVSETVEDVGKHMEGPTKAIGGLVETFENLEKKTGFIHDWGTSTGNSVEDARKPWQKFKDTVTMIYNTVTDWTRKRLDEFGILEDGKTLGEKLKEFFGSVIDAIKNFDYDKALNFLTTLGTKLGIVFGIFAAAIGHINITKAVSQIPGMFNNISTTIRSFSPFYADVMKADNKTTRREAMADILKSFAFVIISIAAAVAVMVWAIDKLSSMHAEGKLETGLTALWFVMAPLLAIIAALVIILALITGKDKSTTSVTNLPMVGSVKGLKKFINLMQNGGLGAETKTVTSQGQSAWKSIAAIAGVIVAFAAAVGIITLAISKLGSLSPEQLEQGMKAFYEIASIIAILLILVGAFALLLRGGTNNRSSKGFYATAVGKAQGRGIGIENNGKTAFSSRDSADWKVITALAVAMLLISAAISGLMLSIAIISNIPTKDLEKGLYIFWKVVKAIAGIIVVLGVMASLMTFFNKGSKGVAGTIIGMAVLMAVIGLIIGGLMQIIVEIAFLPIEDVTTALDILNEVTGAIIAIILILGVVLIGLTAFAAFGNKNGQVTKAMLSVSLTIAMIAGLFVAIGFSMALMGAAIGEMALAFYALDENKLGSVIAIIGMLVGMVVLVMAAAAVMVGLAKAHKDTTGIALILAGIVAIFGVLGLLFYAIGYMAKMIADSGMDINSLMGIVISVTVLVGLVMIATAVIVGLCATGVGEGILGTLAIITAMFAAIGFMFIGIGAAAYLIGSGIDILVDAFIKFFTFIESLNEDKTTRVQSNLERFMYGLGTIIFAGLLGIASFLDTNRERVVDAIKKIIKFIMEAILASVVQTFETGLDSLGEMIDIFDTWLNQHAFEIERIITNVGNIIFTAIDNFMDNLMKLILGENYDGGTDGYLGQVTQGIIKWLYTYFLNDDAVGRTLLADLFRVIGQQAHDGIIEFFDLIINSQDIPTKALEAVDSVIVGITNGLITEGPKIIDHVKELFRVVWQLILYTLGVSDVPPQSSMFGVTGGAIKGDPEGTMEGFGDQMGDGLKNVNWTEAVGSFLNALWNTILNIASTANRFIPCSGGLVGVGEWIASKIVSGIHEGGEGGSPWGATEQEGIWALEGLNNGLTNRRRNRDLYNSAINIANVVVGGVAGAITLSNTTENFVNGITKELSKLKTRLAPLFDGLLEGIDAKISPYMDLTQIEEGFGSIQDMMNGNSSFDISALNSGDISDLSSNLTDSDIAVGTAEGFDDANSPDLGILGDVDTETIVNFTQNNYSPESLDRIDIYRDTKNLFNNPTLLGNVARMLHSGGGGGSF